MSIAFEVKKDGETEMYLTEYSIKDFDFTAESELNMSLRSGNITRDIILSGVIDPGMMSVSAPENNYGEPALDKQGNQVIELDEFNSVRKLANWAVIPEYCDCYKDIEVKITNAIGVVVKKDYYENFYVVKYTEGFDDSSGVGKFEIVLREREIRHKGLNPERDPDAIAFGRDSEAFKQLKELQSKWRTASSQSEREMLHQEAERIRSQAK